jgi:hypothetical protein
VDAFNVNLHRRKTQGRPRHRFGAVGIKKMLFQPMAGGARES